MKKNAYCIHHTHWDPFWYFTAYEASVQFNYNMKELLETLDNGRVKDFYLDGQTAAIEDYIRRHPEDVSRLRHHIKHNRLFIGPFHSQLDCFISSGEALINNLRLGMKTAEMLGGVSTIAYLPDSFGHSQDFPKVFNRFGIHDFVITRGVGDEYALGSEFYLASNDGSRVLVYTMISGYGYGAYGFKDGTLLTDAAEDYNKLNVHALIERLISKSTVPETFVFPLGFDQNPVILDIEKKITDYNRLSEVYRFIPTTWKAYMALVREKGVDLKTHKHELFSTQYHRVHRSIYSARADIKTLQDKTERVLAYEVQPLMTMLDHLGLAYDQALLDQAWEMLIRCQTHASATLTDETNRYVFAQSESVLSLANACKAYLMKITALSLPRVNSTVMPLVIFNTLPDHTTVMMRMKLFTEHEHFTLRLNQKALPYTVINTHKRYAGVLRKDPTLMNEAKHYYETIITLMVPGFNGIGYKTVFIEDGTPSNQKTVAKTTKDAIENTRYRLMHDATGLHLFDKQLNITMRNLIHIEDAGDEGDNYDYSYPDEDFILKDYLSSAEVVHAYQTDTYGELRLKGQFNIPADLNQRIQKKSTALMTYDLSFSLSVDADVITVKGRINNPAKNHRVRLVFSTEHGNKASYAGTQFGFIERETDPVALHTWRKDNWFEEPSPIWPLLNYVAIKNSEFTLAAFTRSVKEYECVGPAKAHLALTLFRAVGYLGLPDLNRRPGRPSGLANKLFETPQSQCLGENRFEVGFALYSDFNPNQVMKDYVRFATDRLYYQDQPFDKTVFNIAYFPTNPLIKTLPESYDLISLKKSEAVFSTLVKSAYDARMVLRIFNAGNHPIAGGDIVGEHLCEQVQSSNLLEQDDRAVKLKIGRLTPGALLNLKIKKKSRE